MTRTTLLAMAAALSPIVAAGAQVPSRLDLGGALEVGSEGERYLRALQLASGIPPVPWTLQPFGVQTERQLAPSGQHPWSSRFMPRDSVPHVRWLRPTERVILNSAFPVQDAVGPAWAGRGATLVVQGGIVGTWAHARIQAAPVAFYAQNTSFDLAPNGLSGDAAFRDPRFPNAIDHPQRFGTRPYGRVDLGSSSVDVELAGVALGASNAPPRWGPAREYPLLLGPAAGGFPHIYLGTAAPVSLPVVRVHLRMLGGTLAQSAYSPAPSEKSRRYASAALVTIEPRAIDGLELGLGRFFESPRALNARRVLLPLSLAKLRGNNPSLDQNEPDENQTASAFFRWLLPRGAVELYGEWYREDYSGSARTFVLLPDDLSAFTLGFQHVVRAGADRQRVVRFELVNGQLSPSERYLRDFSPNPPYIHAEVRQGHTLRGALLGSAEAYGGAGWRAALDTYTPSGRRTVAVERYLRLESLAGSGASVVTGHPDVIYAMRGEWLRFAGERDYGITILPAIDLNHNLQGYDDRFNLHASFTIRGW